MGYEVEFCLSYVEKNGISESMDVQKHKKEKVMKNAITFSCLSVFLSNMGTLSFCIVYIYL